MTVTPLADYFARIDRLARTDRAGQLNRPNQLGHPGHPNQLGHPGHLGHPGRPGQSDRSGQLDQSGTVGRSAPNAPPVIVTIELRVPLEDAGRGLAETVDALRAAVGRIDGARVRVEDGLRDAIGTALDTSRSTPPPGTPAAQLAPSVPAQTGASAAQLAPSVPAQSGAPAATASPQPAWTSSTGAEHIDDAAIRILPDERSVWSGSQEIRLSRLEFDLLLFFADNPRRVFSRVQLLESVWGYTHASRRTVDVHIRRLRAKLGEANPLLTTIRGVGYRLDGATRVAVVRQHAAA